MYFTYLKKNHHFLENVYSIKIHLTEFQLTDITQIFCFRMEKKSVSQMTDRMVEEAKKDTE